MKPVKDDPNEYPPGWDRHRVEAVIRHYETQSDAEGAAEDDAAFSGEAHETIIAVPDHLVPRVRELLREG